MELLIGDELLVTLILSFCPPCWLLLLYELLGGRLMVWPLTVKLAVELPEELLADVIFELVVLSSEGEADDVFEPWLELIVLVDCSEVVPVCD
jgi:hypothetical protein